MLEKKAQTAVGIDDTLARRWSPRAFDPAQPVAREQLLALLEAARWAPSCYGDEPWRYIVWDRTRDPDGWQKAFECLAESNQKWVANAPLLLASLAGSHFSRNGKPNRWAQHDTGAASENLVLQATALGLAAHQMGGFDADRLRQQFGIPDEFTPMAMIAVGHQAEPDTLPADLKERETGPRKRRPLEETFFEGAFGQPIDARMRDLKPTGY